MVSKLTKFVVVFFILTSLAIIVYSKYFFNNVNNIFLFSYGLIVTSVIFFTFLISYVKYKDPAKKIDNKVHNLKKPFVSCVVAAYNEPLIIKRCVNSLLNSTYKNKEIIVVNDASTDSTKEALDEFKGIEGVRIIHLKKNIGKKGAITEGLKIAKGNIFVFTDSDCVVAPDAIDTMIKIFLNDPKVGGACGHGRALNANENFLTKIQDTWYETQYSVEKALESSYSSVSCLSGPLAVFRKEAIWNFIPAWVNDKFLGNEFRFATDRQLTGYVLGSTIIGKKLKKKYAGSSFMKPNYPERYWKVVYSKSAKVWTVVPNTFKKLLRQHVRWKKSFIRNLFFTGSFYWRKPTIPAAKYYLGALFTVIGPFIALRQLIYLPMSGDPIAPFLYLGGILFIGSLYGLAYKIESPRSQAWIYRPFMSVLSTLCLSWLIFYSAITIKKNIWHRGG